LQQPLSRQLVAAFHRPRRPRVVQVDLGELAALGDEAKAYHVTIRGHLLGRERREPVAAAALGVSVVTDSDERAVEQVQRNARHALAIERLPPELGIDELPYRRQARREAEQLLEVPALVLLDP